MELEFLGNLKYCRIFKFIKYLDEEIDRLLPDSAMLKIYTYQNSMKKIQALFFSSCSAKVNGKLRKGRK